MTAPSGHISYCDTHGKVLFTSRRMAREDLRRRHSQGMRPYRCGVIGGHWHVGHLPPAVREGRLTAREIYGSAS